MKKPETKIKSSKATQAPRGVSVVKEVPKLAVKKAGPGASKIAAAPKVSGGSRSKAASKSSAAKKSLTPIPGPQGSKLVQSGKSGLAISRNVKPASSPSISDLIETTPGGKPGATLPKRSKRGREKSLKPDKSKGPLKLIQVIPKQRPNAAHNIPVKKEKMLMRYGKPTKRLLYTVDFLLKASPTIVYHFITTPSCLVRWFCDAVDITGEYFTFSWNGSTEVAELIDDIEDERLKFQWLDGEDEDEFFEFKISTADITDETILEITDFAWADEVDEQKELWRTQVENLRKETGDA